MEKEVLELGYIENIDKIENEISKKEEVIDVIISKMNFLKKLRKNEKFIFDIEQVKENIIKEKSGVFVFKYRIFINSFIILLILLLLRIGPLLCSPRYIVDEFTEEIGNITRWNSTEIEQYVSVPTWPSSIVSWIFIIVYFLISRFSFPKIIERLKKMKKTMFFGFLIRNLKSPFLLLLNTFFIIILSQIIFILGIYFNQNSVVIISRIIYGLMDPLNLVLVLFLYIHLFIKKSISKIFRKKNFSMSIGFLLSTNTLNFMVMNFIIYLFPNVYYYISITIFFLILSMFGMHLNY
jgi:hypothetical protein